MTMVGMVDELARRLQEEGPGAAYRFLAEHPAHAGRLRESGVRGEGRSLPPVDAVRHGLDVVALQPDVARAPGQADADAAGRPARLADLVAGDRHALRLALHVDRDPVLGAAVGDEVALQPVAVRGER